MSLLEDIKPGYIVLAGEKQFKVTKVGGIETERSVVIDTGWGVHEQSENYLGDKKLKPGDGFTAIEEFRAQVKGTYYGFVEHVSLEVDGIPTWHSGVGRLDAGDRHHYTLWQLLSGDAEAWKALNDDPDDFHVDVECAFVMPGSLVKPPTPNLKGIVKMDLMAYVVAVNGPMVRDDIMRQVAAIEGKPWIPTSNKGYFTGENGPSVTCRKIILEDGKVGRKIRYVLGPEGEKRAKKVIDQIGTSPAVYAK